MKTGTLSAVALGLVLAGTLTTSCRFGDRAFQASFSRSEKLTVPLADLTAIDVKTNVGKIQLDATEGAEAGVYAHVKVDAVTEERAQELAEGVRIVAEPSGRTLTIRAVKPSGMGREPLWVGLTITAPAGLAINATTNVGDISITGFTTRVEARADVGRITGTNLRDAVDMHTNVGDIRIAYLPDAPPILDVRGATNVGNIDFAGPAEISAKLSAEVNVGSIHTDRPLTVIGSMKQSIKASLGDGQGKIDLHTNVGSIHIR